VLTFELWLDDVRDGPEHVHIEPSQVAAVWETQFRRAYGGWQQVAVIHLRNGKEYAVHDSGRHVVTAINAAQRELENVG
jgi:hypothetical protein